MKPSRVQPPFVDVILAALAQGRPNGCYPEVVGVLTGSPRMTFEGRLCGYEGGLVVLRLKPERVYVPDKRHGTYKTWPSIDRVIYIDAAEIATLRVL